MNKNNGITLIALIITIVVMMILVGVTVIVTLNGGLFKKTQEGAFKSAVSKLDEQVYGQREISKYTEETFIYNGIVPDEIKDFIDVSGTGDLLYIGDPKKQQAIWAREMGINSLSESGYKQKSNYKELMDFAKEYVANGKSTTSPNLLALQYARRNRYNGTLWKLTVGAVDQNFVKYVDENKTNSLDITNFEDPITGSNIDFIHSMAALNSYLVMPNNSLSEYTCWMGDLCEILIDVHKYKIENGLTDQSPELQNYSDSLIGATSNSKFSLEDVLADIDAINISKLIKEDDDLDQAIYSYYYGSNANYSKNRYYYFRKHMQFCADSYISFSKTFSDDEITYRVTRNLMYRNSNTELLINNLNRGVTYNEITVGTQGVVATSFANFINSHVE